MELSSIILSPFILVFSLGMLLTSLMSYHRSKNLKLLFVSLVFLLFFLRGIFLAAGSVFDEFNGWISLFSFGVLDLIILLLLFLATLKR